LEKRKAKLKAEEVWNKFTESV